MTTYTYAELLTLTNTLVRLGVPGDAAWVAAGRYLSGIGRATDALTEASVRGDVLLAASRTLQNWALRG